MLKIVLSISNFEMYLLKHTRVLDKVHFIHYSCGINLFSWRKENLAYICLFKQCLFSNAARPKAVLLDSVFYSIQGLFSISVQNLSDWNTYGKKMFTLSRENEFWRVLSQHSREKFISKSRYIPYSWSWTQIQRKESRSSAFCFQFTH